VDAQHTSIGCDIQELPVQAPQGPQLRAEKATVLLLLSNPADWSLGWSESKSQAWRKMFSPARFSVLEAELAYLRQQLHEVPALTEDTDHLQAPVC
jgi:hypothetical protein